MNTYNYIDYNTLLLFIHLTMKFTLTSCLDKHASGLTSQCEYLRPSFCQQEVNWRTTHYPNVLGHTTQEQALADLSPYHVVMQSGCSENLTFVLCGTHMSPCASDPTKRHLPCREFCREAKRSCRRTLVRNELSWPPDLECGKLPKLESGNCVTPESVRNLVPGPVKDGELMENDVPEWGSLVTYIPRCDCPVVNKKLQKKVYMEMKYNYVIHGQFKSAEGIRGGPLVLRFKIIQVLKDIFSLPESNFDITLWVSRGCTCTNLFEGREYLVLGHGDSVHRRLLFDEESMAIEWKDSWYNKLNKWETSIQSRHEKKSSKIKHQNVKKRRKIGSFAMIQK